MKKSEIDRNYEEAHKRWVSALSLWEVANGEYTASPFGTAEPPGPRPKEPRRIGRPTECEVDECERPPLQRGYCNYHYARWRSGKNPTEKAARPGRPVSMWNGATTTRMVHVPMRIDLLEALDALAGRERTSRADVLNRVLALSLDLSEYLPSDPRATTVSTGEAERPGTSPTGNGA